MDKTSIKILIVIAVAVIAVFISFSFGQTDCVSFKNLVE